MVKRVLMIAFHYPPGAGSSGVHRVTSFVRHLPEHGWEPIVLTASAFAHAKTSGAAGPSGVTVRRAPALDAARHLSIANRYPAFTRWPDRWSTWWLTGVPAALALIRSSKPALIWSTYPIATAHLIGLTLHKLTGIRWLADFRDGMTEPGYPRDRRVRAIFQRIEARTIARASGAIFTAPGAVKMYRERYPEKPPDFWHRIANGYDEAQFPSVAPPRRDLDPDRQLSLLHAGILYPSERDPRPFFSAVARLKQAGVIGPDRLQIKLRATGHDDVHRRLIDECGIADIVHLLPLVPYEQAIEEMMRQDGLLLFQASNCNRQIPAKLYEYLRAGRPVLALTDPSGDTAQELQGAGIDSIVDLEDEDSIARGLKAFLERVRHGEAPTAPAESVERYSRRARAAELARLLDVVSGAGAA